MRIVLLAAFAVACGKSGGGVEKIADEKESVIGFAANDKAVAWTASRKDASELIVRVGDVSTTIVQGFSFHVQLGSDAVYWSDGEHVWSASFDGKTRAQLAAIEDVKDLYLDGETLYWVSRDKLGRIRKGGASEVVFSAPADKSLSQVAASGTTVVAVTHDGPTGTIHSELWRIDGEPKSIDRAATKSTSNVVIDGDRIVWELGGGVDEVPLAGGARKHVSDARFIAAAAGTTYVDDRKAETIAISGSSSRRVGPRCSIGAVAGKRLYCKFVDGPIGSVAVE